MHAITTPLSDLGAAEPLQTATGRQRRLAFLVEERRDHLSHSGGGEHRLWTVLVGVHFEEQAPQHRSLLCARAPMETLVGLSSALSCIWVTMKVV